MVVGRCVVREHEGRKRGIDKEFVDGRVRRHAGSNVFERDP